MAMIPLLVARLQQDILQVIQEMGDIEYLSKKEFDGKLREDDGSGGTGVVATLTANTGKDMYLGSAKMTHRRSGNSSGTFSSGTMQLRVNGVVKDTCNFSYSAGAGSDGGVTALNYGTYDFPVGFKVLAGEVIDLNVTSLGTNLSVTGEIQCFEEDTGSDPTILASSITVDASLTSTGLLAGDFGFLSKKEFDGKRVDVDALLTLTNNSTQTDLVTQTANGGKDMYLAEASIGGQVVGIAANPIGGVTYRLFANGVEVDRYREEDPPVDAEWTHVFTTKGIKVLAGEIIKITAQNAAAGNNVISTSQGKLVLWEEDTGADPLG